MVVPRKGLALDNAFEALEPGRSLRVKAKSDRQGVATARLTLRHGNTDGDTRLAHEKTNTPATVWVYMTRNTGESDSPRLIQSVETSFAIIETLQEQEGAGITELARELDLSKTAVYHHVMSLKELGYVVRDGNAYKLSLRFLNLGKYIQINNDLYEEGKPVVDELADRSREKSHLTIEENGRLVYLYKAEAEEAVGRQFPVGERDYLHHSAAGKAILAHLPEEQTETIIEESGLPSRTENTITDGDELREELARVRENGYAINDEEEIRGIKAVAAPVMGESGAVIASVSVSGPATRLDGQTQRELSEMVQEAANILQIRLNTDLEDPEWSSDSDV